METLNAYLEIEEDASQAAACRACTDMPEQLLCPACELDVPCDRCGGAVAFRSLGTTALLCAACTRRAIEESEAPESRLALWLHRAITVAATAGVIAVEWVAFNPSWSGAGLAVHGTLTDIGAIVGAAMIAAYFAGHGVVERIWPDGRPR